MKKNKKIKYLKEFFHSISRFVRFVPIISICFYFYITVIKQAILQNINKKQCF